MRCQEVAQLMAWRQILVRFPEQGTLASGTSESGTMAAVRPASPTSPAPSASPTFPSSAFNPSLPSQHAPSRQLTGPQLSQATSSSPEYTLPAGREQLVPRKFDSSQDVLSLPLTRPQRSIYLLIDGKRTIADLARTTRKSLQEIVRLLNELHTQDLIVY